MLRPVLIILAATGALGLAACKPPPSMAKGDPAPVDTKVDPAAEAAREQAKTDAAPSATPAEAPASAPVAADGSAPAPAGEKKTEAPAH